MVCCWGYRDIETHEVEVYQSMKFRGLDLSNLAEN